VPAAAHDDEDAMTGPTPSRPKQVHLAPGVWAPSRALRYSFVQSSGPGGQNVNKRSTKAVLRVALADLGLRDEVAERLRSGAGHRLTQEDELVLSSDEHRSQRRNREACLDLLRALLVEASRRPKKRKPTKPSRGAVQRRIDEKKQRSETKARRRDRGDW
jgi:ribosome-associated protein